MLSPMMPGTVAVPPLCRLEECVWIRGTVWRWFGLEAEFDINPLLSFKCSMIHYLRRDPISGALGKLCERQAEVV